MNGEETIENAVPVAPANTAGARLAQLRERSGYTLMQVADDLHLDAAVVQRIEADDFRDLGAAVYVRGHLRRYARLLGEDPTLIEALYRAASGESRAPDLTRIVTQPYTSAPRSRRLGTWPSVALGAIILFGGLVWWAVQQPKPKSATVGPAATASGEASSPAQPSGVPATSQSTGAMSANDASGGTATAAVGAGAPSAAVGQIPVDSASADANPAGSSGLQLRFNADSWAEVYSQNGERRLYDLMTAGTTRRFVGGAPWRVILGNVSGVSVQVDGKSVTLPEASGDDPIVRAWLDRDGRVRPIR